MTSSNHPEIDVARMQADLLREETRREAAPVLWRIRQWVLSLTISGVMFVLVIPLISGDGPRAFDPDGVRLWLRIAGAFILTAVTLAMGDRRARIVLGDPNAATAKLKKEHEQLTGAGWTRRTVLLGTKMGLAVGVPIGLLLVAIPLPAIEQAGLWGRLGMFGMFVGGTFLWTLPAAFAIRWLSLTAMKKYLVQP